MTVFLCQSLFAAYLLCIICMLVLDPNISLEGLLADASRDEDSEAQISHIRHCRDELEAHFKRHYASVAEFTSSGTSSSVMAVPSSSPSKMDSSVDFFARYRTKKLDQACAHANELEKYFRLDPADAHSIGMTALEWWNKHKNTFPCLSRLARDIFSIPGMSILCGIMPYHAHRLVSF